MNKLFGFTIILILSTGCLVTPAALPSQAMVPPPGYTPSGIAAQKVIADAQLSDAQKQAALVQAAIAEATAVAQATRDSLSLSATATQAALDAAIAQHAATATAQAIDAAVKATQQSLSSQATQQAVDLSVHATQTAVAVRAAISATAQTAYERKIAFDQSAAVNQANLQRENDSANFRTVLYSVSFIALIAICLYYLRDVLRTKAALARIIKTPMGEYKMRLLKDGVVVFEPMLALAAPADRAAAAAAIDQPAARTIKVDQIIDVPAGGDEYWKWERECRSNAAELLDEAMDCLGPGGQSSRMLPGHEKMKWSGETHDRYKKPIARYFISKPGRGSTLVDDRYPTLYALYLGVKARTAPIDVVDNEGHPIPLTQFD